MGQAAHRTRVVSGAERERLTATLCKDYVKGASLRELANQSGRSYGFVRSVLTEAGVTLRGRGGTRRSPGK